MTNDMGLRDPYEDQLSAARFKAERDLARQEIDRMRPAFEWVRDHGGIEVLRRMFHDADSRRVELCAALGIDLDKGWSDAMAAMRLRLVPEGMEWPRFEDGEPVRIGDSAPFGTDDVMEVVGVEINRFGYVLHGSIDDGMMGCVDGDEHGVAVKRPTPKVLDADGVEVELGDDLYSVEGSLKFHVSHVDRANGKIATDAMFAIDKWADPSLFTHRAPVLAADGKPLRVGEHVYHVETGAELVVKELPKPGEYQAVVVFAPPASHLTSFDPDQLTHERPVADSWERWREEWQWPPVKYCKLILGVEYDHDTQLQESFDAQGEDLVRRARALAERDGS